MIEMLPESSGRAVGAKFSGEVTHEDYTAFLPQVQSVMAEQGKIRFLLLAEDMHWDLRGLVDDLRYTVTFASNVERVAIVGDRTWQRLQTAIVDHLIRTEMRFFPTDQIQKAWAWLRAEG